MPSSLGYLGRYHFDVVPWPHPGLTRAPPRVKVAQGWQRVAPPSPSRVKPVHLQESCSGWQPPSATLSRVNPSPTSGAKLLKDGNKLPYLPHLRLNLFIFKKVAQVGNKLPPPPLHLGLNFLSLDKVSQVGNNLTVTSD